MLNKFPQQTLKIMQKLKPFTIFWNIQSFFGFELRIHGLIKKNFVLEFIKDKLFYNIVKYNKNSEKIETIKWLDQSIH
jgi:hypothetical protein